MFATIDIGTNSVLLLIGKPKADGTVQVLEDRMTVTKLGEGLAATQIIKDTAIERTLNALHLYHELCAKHDVSKIALVGTHTLRVAKNSANFLKLVKDILGSKVEVISTRQEASLTYKACAHDFGTEIVVIDIGGGSTEFIIESDINKFAPSPSPSPLPRGERVRERVTNVASLPLGSVTHTELFLKSDPVSDTEISSLRKEVYRALETKLDPVLYARPHDKTLVATAGTATMLMAMHLKLTNYDPGIVHGQKLKISDLRNLIGSIRPKTIAERKTMAGLDPARADVIIAGAEILEASMSFLGFADTTISDRGVKWGLFYEKFCTG